MTIFVAVYALVFGCMQGAFAVANASLLMANNTIALLGIALAGVVIACVPRAFGSLQRIDLIHRASLILFVPGAVVANCCMGAGTAVGGLFVVSQIALLAGFNLFDFGVLVYEITSRRAENGEEAEEGREQPVTDHSRPIVYLGLTGGLLISHALISTVPAAALPTALSLVCGASIVVLVTTVLIPFYNSNPAVEMPTCIGCTHLTLPALSVPPVDGALVAGAGAGGSVAGGAVPDDWESPWRRACNGIARQYQLSPRETEIFFMVAKGRNAEYIQQELVISTHTAKTHIANIYRKLDVHSSQELLDLVEEARGESSEDTPA
ncbi:MAG: helix-turn-helix transcriptional regulator [Eggerthellaceae bacterium]|nr:helix-turn-helix transcriptional regulator [Eggerthellaceae bacterium]